MAERPAADVVTDPVWSAGAVAAHLGVSVSTLRSWNRRYGLGPERHSFGRHRRYSASDVARLEEMRRLVTRGMAPADAAHWVQTRSAGVPAPAEPTPGVPAPAEPTPGAPAPAEPTPGAPAPAEPTPGATRNEDPDAPIPTARAVSGLLDAAERLDSVALADAVNRHLSDRGVVRTWVDICVPALVEIGRRNAERGDCVDVEHLLSWVIGAGLHQIRPRGVNPGARVALLACVEDERHTLALDALRAALAERGAAVRMLGAATPTPALCAAIERARPGAVLVWAQTARTARPSLLAEPVAAVHAAGGLLLAAGPGWERRRLPAGVDRVESLHNAVLLTVGATASPV